MKRIAFLAVLMVASSSAHADSSFSLVVAGHRIRVGAPYDCASPSCVSVSIAGLHETRRRHERADAATASAPRPRPARPSVAPAQPAAAPSIAPQDAAQNLPAVEQNQPA